jgi:general secretion pathway protein E
LTLEALTVWLAKKVNLPHQRIDPLKIDIQTVTNLISYKYAKRFNILPVAVSQDRVVIATADPYITQWMKELSPVLRRKIVRVIANPADIRRHLLEFYSLAQSVKHTTPEKEKVSYQDSKIANLRPSNLQGKLELEKVLDDLVTDGLVLKEDAEGIFALPPSKRSRETHPFIVIADQKITNLLSPHNFLTAETLVTWLSQKVNIPYRRIDPLKIDVESVTSLEVSFDYLKRFNILPIEVSEDRVVIATAEPHVTEWMKELSPILRREIVRVITNPADISRYLLEFYSLTRSVKHAAGEKAPSPVAALSDLEQLVALGRTGKLDANDQHIVHIVDWLLQYAFDQRASDIHTEPRRDVANIRFRIDGVLHLVYQLPLPVMNAVTSRIKVLGRMDVAEKRRPQDGRLKTKTPQGTEVELRLSIMPTTFGEKLVMRIFDPDVLTKTFEELGLENKDLKRWREFVERPHGIVLVTGPTGSGKTTTLYSTLKHLAKPELNVCTVEDPIEMVEPTINQMQVHPAIGLTFANGVRTLLRQDPDIIMVGEIRDLETAEMAIQASLTGHLVLSTLHTNDAASALTRLLDIGVPYYLIQATLLGITAQRLVRTLCPYCKQEGSIDDKTWQLLSSPWEIPKPESVFLPKGCPECRGTGYLGRVAIFEMLKITPGVEKLIHPDMPLERIREQGIKEGMNPLRKSGAYKVAAGLTTAEEVFKVVPPR